MKSIRIYFHFFNANQFFSPILGEYKYTKERLHKWGLSLQSQFKRHPRIPSKLLPCGIHITYFINKDNFDPTSLCILTHKIVNLLELHCIIQAINNKTVHTISFTTKIINRYDDEGCEISFVMD